jgi:ABC-type ATPase involved in cell division
MPYLQIDRVSKSFGTFQALKEVSLEIEEGKFVCFLGPPAAVRPRSFVQSPGSTSRPPAASCKADGTSRRCLRRSAISASSSSPMRCSRT